MLRSVVDGERNAPPNAPPSFTGKDLDPTSDCRIEAYVVGTAGFEPATP